MDSQQGSDAVVPEFHVQQSRLTLSAGRRAWADVLRRHGVAEYAALFLEAAGPLALVLAQLLHLATPFAGMGARRAADFLESPGSMSDFTDYLKKGPDTGPAGGRDGA